MTKQRERRSMHGLKDRSGTIVTDTVLCDNCVQDDDSRARIRGIIAEGNVIRLAANDWSYTKLEKDASYVRPDVPFDLCDPEATFKCRMCAWMNNVTLTVDKVNAEIVLAPDDTLVWVKYDNRYFRIDSVTFENEGDPIYLNVSADNSDEADEPRPFTGQSLDVVVPYLKLREKIHTWALKHGTPHLASTVTCDLDNYVRDITGVKAK